MARSVAEPAAVVDVAAGERAKRRVRVLDEGRWTNTLPCVPGEPCEGGTDAAGRPVNVVRAPDTSIDGEEIRAFVGARLARHKVPRDVTFVAELPRNTTGKLLRTQPPEQPRSDPYR